jgi:HEAT repeat protein
VTTRSRLHRLLNLAIDSYKEQHPHHIPEVDPDDYDDLWEATVALRERDRIVARPVILRALEQVLESSRDAAFRQEAATYLGESWDYYQDDAAVIRVLTLALYDPADQVRPAAARALGRMGTAAAPALPALRAIASSSSSAELNSAVNEAIQRILGRV